MGVSMNAYAVIESGGKQYRVEEGNTFKVERLTSAVGEKLTLQPVLIFCDGTALTVGNPHVADTKVIATVLRHLRGPKLIAYKQKRRKNFSRKKGHRQELTEIKIEGIQHGN
jgi:large subunit ribosomal protein L21